jgi:hypothetical protein
MGCNHTGGDEGDGDSADAFDLDDDTLALFDAKDGTLGIERFHRVLFVVWVKQKLLIIPTLLTFPLKKFKISGLCDVCRMCAM